MATVTIPRKLSQRGELVVIPREEYEELLRIKATVRTVEPTDAERRSIRRGEREIRQGRYRDWSSIKHDLARRPH